MTDPRHTRTNAADSAPGVDDGRAGVNPPPVNSKPGARRPVFWILGASLVVLAVIFLARPQESATDDAMIATGATRGEVVASDMPGASQPEPAPAQP
ncbi:MAG: hypothetical protein ACK41C_00880 [Phenylobacterium sp.]|jgi:hypothetical protein|uniref:hypothetical protein n=1 Tax=Phenylobacterium sp. TaxID=1871053 RepID=UPI00391AE22D